MQQPSPSSARLHSTHHPDSPALRRRADELRRLAASIERSLVMTLDDAAEDRRWNGARARLCERMLSHNQHQLHEAADDLRQSAFELTVRADELDLAHRAA